MKVIIRIIVVSFFIMSTAISLKSQDTLAVNLETVLKLAGANNLTVEEYRLKYQQALAEQDKTSEWWLPKIYGGITTHYLNGAAMNTDGRIFTNLNRDYLWTGLGIAAEIDFSKGFYQTIASKQKSNAAYYFSIEEKNHAILKAVLAYYDLQSEELKYLFLKSLAEQADTIGRQIKIQVDAGLRYQSEYKLAQSNYNHFIFEMLQAKIDWQKQSSLLANLLNLEASIRLISADTALIPLPNEIKKIDTAGFQNRPEFLGLYDELLSIKSSRKTFDQGLFLPKLRIGFDNAAFGAYQTTLYNTYQFNASLLWSFPLGRLTYNGDLKQWDNKILLQQNKLEQFKNQFDQEIRTAADKVQVSGEQMNTAKESFHLTQEALSQSIDRQAIGTAKPFEVFQAQQFFMEARIDYLKAVTEYNKAQFELMIAKGHNL